MPKLRKLLMSRNTQASPTLSDVFYRLDCELNELQSAVQTPKARAAALATVDQDIDVAKRLILSVLTRRNTLAPISILPAEVLSRIFHFTAFSDRFYSTRCWVHVTHVCRRWRQIALDDSTLWTQFTDSPRNKDWIAERLARSRNAPLVLSLDGWAVKDTLSLFTPHISHTRELMLFDLSCHPEIVQEISIQKAPILEYLKFRELGSLPMDNEHIGHLFFKGTLPKLRILELSTVFPWSLFPCGQLTELKVILDEEVSAATSKDSQHDDLNQLIGLLVASPSLEDLTLQGCLPTMLGSKSSDGQTIHLPRLSQLCLGGSSSRVTNLFKMLRLSPSTRLRLYCTPEDSATDNDYPILPILSEHFNDSTHVKFRTFELDLHQPYGVIEIMASTSLPMSPIPRSRHILAGDPELSLSFYRVSDLNRLDILRRACNVLFLSKLDFFSISFHNPNQVINWSEIFQHSTEVTTVQVDGCGTIGLLEALTPPNLADTAVRGKPGKSKRGGDNGRGAQAEAPDDSDSHAPAPVHVPIFPKLMTLRLNSLDFNDVVPGSGVLFDLVLNVVQRRKVNETPLTTLRIEQCDIRVKQADALEKLVCDFQWDHHEGNHNDKSGNLEDHHSYHGFEFDDDGDDYSDSSDPGVW